MATLSPVTYGNLMQTLRQRADHGNDLHQMRKDLHAFGALYPPHPNVTIQAMTVGGRPTEMLTPADHYKKLVLLYLHGGGFVMGSIQTHRQLASHLAAATGVRTMVAEYRLAPENPFPAALEDALSVYTSLLRNGFDPCHIGLAGDSAGGGLCVSLMTRLKQEKLPLPRVCCLLSPWVDLSMRGPSWHRNADQDVLVKSNDAKRMAALYLNGKDPLDPLVSPVYADLEGIPPLLIHVGSGEVLLDDAVSLHKRATHYGVTSHLDIWDGMPHVWHFMSPVLKEGRVALQQAAAFITAHMPGG